MGTAATQLVEAQSFDTLALHAGTVADPTTGALLTPIYQTTTYRQEAVGKDKGFTYSRSANPTVSALERRLAALEGADYCTCYATGLAATTALCLALLRAGDHVVASQAVYGGTVRLFKQVLEPFGVTADFVDTADEADLREAVNSKPTRFVFIETPANPTLKLTDIEIAAKIAHEAGTLLVVDNTLLTPALQRPFELQADVVLHSTTKFIEGHNATVGGALITRNPELHERFSFTRNAIGAIQSPFPAWLTIQGVKTVGLRMAQHSANALEIARFLEAWPRRFGFDGAVSGATDRRGVPAHQGCRRALHERSESWDINGAVCARELYDGGACWWCGGTTEGD